LIFQPGEVGVLLQWRKKGKKDFLGKSNWEEFDARKSTKQLLV